MKLAKVVLACTLFITVACAQDIIQKSMSTMEKGITQIQQGFLNNNLELIKSGTKLVKEGNSLFNDKNVIEKYLPKDKKHMVNVAENTSRRIALDINVLELNLEVKAYLNAANAYSDMLNACSRCHSIVRSW
ncbi:hypothetical protein CPU12_03260 [Malaciobacter molluscorum LMG 25693]|uniref:Cytochrome C n=1 Tax=Malaciobacter molluscorum LMG 25693 TaxID=870501 RepID=A0A2G1DKA6_9BACT|nr:hypothetical protein [Malaciobacter molluscorum]AXX91357.1 hypothetical protein AMOL_0341 [Malaciobacter molluscorum LMG 25693]PHO18890.1 hypothetical protein CPU12_03260 [Malaciobacter molluscorum LMG 25693]RXJ94359.1 hypothetical protein CRV00_07235 [Malaciobacter molluscorum]